MKKHFLALLVASLIPIAAEAQVQSLVASNTVFALNLYGELATNSGNLFFSPYSISTCLAMLYAGARNDTERQMSEVLGFDTNQTQFASSFAELQARLKTDQQTNAIELDIANALWTQAGYPFLPAFLENATNQYQASINQADFVTSADTARQAINNWVAQKTQDKIQNILAPGSLDPLTRLVLANAIYFKGIWTVSFALTNTIAQAFNVSSSEQVQVPMMHQPPLATNLYNYVETGSFQALDLPYGSNQLSMVILLPKQVDGYGQLEEQLSPDFLAGVLASMKMQSVDIFLPRFTLQSDFDLSNALSKMGMPGAFTPQVADFSGIDGIADLFVSFIRHKAWGEVNETGTEAAAATVSGISTAVAGGTAVFRADHPFLFFIRDTESGSILFLGRLVDPGQAGAEVPQLNVALTSASTLVFSWPASSAPYVLQENSSLTAANWTTLTNTPAVLGQQNEVVLSRLSGSKFYRLIAAGN
jgi:serine protease inhibitor